MTTKGRKAGFQMGAEHRSKIGTSMIFNRLIRHAEGKEDMKPTEITAAISLLDRVMPKLQSIEMSGDPESPIVTELVLRGVKADN